MSPRPPLRFDLARAFARARAFVRAHASARFSARALARPFTRASTRPIARVALATALALGVTAPPVGAQIHHVAEMNTEQIRALDRDRTVVLLPGGILEEHGPYLPAYSDGYYNEHMTETLARAVADRPGWEVLVFPPIPLGSGGANEIGRKWAHPGTYAVRPATLRAVFMDLASELGEQGFRRVFVINAHGSPDHNRALDRAGDYFGDVYGGTMVHLWGLQVDDGSQAILEDVLGPEGMAENGFTVHSGVGEHSRLLHLRPDLVGDLTGAPSVTATSPAELIELAHADGWPGYFGAPRLATAELGRRLTEASVNAYVRAALEILDGKDPAAFGRYADFMYGIPEINLIMSRSREHDAERARLQREWLERDQPPPGRR